MKGQYLAIEQMLFFAIGIALVIMVYFSFVSINSGLRNRAIESQLYKTGETIRGNVVNIFEISNTTRSYITYELSVPTSASGCTYEIRVDLKNLNLNCTEDRSIGAVLSLYGINTIEKNILYSGKGAVQIISDGSLVELK